MKKIYAVFFVIFLAVVGVALAAYDKRLAELQNQVKDAPNLSEIDKTALNKVFKEYLSERENSFNILLGYIGDPDKSKKTETFRRSVSELSDKIFKFNTEMFKLSKPGFDFFSNYEFEELTFLDPFKKITLPETRDTIIELNENLEKHIKELSSKWEALNSSDNNYDNQEEAVKEDLKKTIEEVIKKIAETKITWKEIGLKFTTDVVGVALNLAGIESQYIDVSLEISKNVTTFLEAKLGYIENRMNEYKKLVNYEENGIFVLFRDTYEDTKDFMDKNSYDKTKSLFESMENDIKSVYNQGTSAQKDDAKDFAYKAIDLSKRHLDKMGTTYNTFILNNAGKFWGPIIPKTIEDLVEKSHWKEEGQKLANLDLEGKLREFRDAGSMNFNYIDQSKITEEDRKIIKAAVEADLNLLLQKIKNTETELSNRYWIFNFDREELANRLTSGLR